MDLHWHVIPLITANPKPKDSQNCHNATETSYYRPKPQKGKIVTEDLGSLSSSVSLLDAIGIKPPGAIRVIELNARGRSIIDTTLPLS